MHSPLRSAVWTHNCNSRAKLPAPGVCARWPKQAVHAPRELGGCLVLEQQEEAETALVGACTRCTASIICCYKAGQNGDSDWSCLHTIWSSRQSFKSCLCGPLRPTGMLSQSQRYHAAAGSKTSRKHMCMKQWPTGSSMVES